MCIKTHAPRNHPAHDRAIGALTEAVEACRDLAEDHDRCQDEDCGCQMAAGLVTALEMFLAFLEGAASSPRPERPFTLDRKASRRHSPAALCCAAR